MTSRHPIAVALVASAFYAGVFVTAAHAEMHYVRVTLVTGQQLTITVDVPPGTPVDQLQIPGLPAPIASIVDLGSVESTPAPTATQAPAVTVEPTPTRVRERHAERDLDARQRQSGTGKTREKVDKTKDQDEGDGREGGQQGLRRRQHRVAHRQGPEARRRPRCRTTRSTRPRPNDPSLSLAEPGAAKIGVPNFFIDKFRIPPFLLPIYQAAGTQYGVRWELLAAINEIETDYGRNLNVSSAGAQGWMQFMPASWEAYGVDGNQDGLMDPYNPVDAIFAAARYLKAAGADKDIRAAVFAYNHADWYVDSVLLRAQVIGGLPSNLVGSLTGLTEGRFPVAAKATYADEVSAKSLRAKRRGNPAVAVEGSENRRGLSIYADAGSPVVAVSDSKVVKIGVSERLGRFVQVQDAYGNTYTYGAPGQDLDAVRRAEAAEGGPGRGPPPARAARAGRGADRPGVGYRAPGLEGAAQGARREGDQGVRAGHARAGRRGGARRQGAPVRAPDARQLVGRRRRPAGVPAHRPDRRRADAGPRARHRARPDRDQAR